MRLIGCYEFGRTPWRLLELAFYDLEEPLDLDAFALGDGASVHLHDVHLLDATGTRALHSDVGATPAARADLVGDVRICFFLELPDEVALHTPLGELYLAAAAPKPHRLRFVEFYQP